MEKVEKRKVEMELKAMEFPFEESSQHAYVLNAILLIEIRRNLQHLISDDYFYGKNWTSKTLKACIAGVAETVFIENADTLNNFRLSMGSWVYAAIEMVMKSFKEEFPE